MIRSLAQRLLGDYALYRIYRSGATANAAADDGVRFGAIDGPGFFNETADPEIAASRRYEGPGAHGFAAWVDDEPVAVCWYWEFGQDRQSATWPIHPGEAKLAQIVTAAGYRGRGIATRLIRYSTDAMRSRGFGALYARVWHSNRASVQAFERAGWSDIALVAQVAPFGAGALKRIVLPAWARLG